MKQPIKTPPIAPCARCGADAKCIDWDFRDRWRVMCDNNHTSTKECGTRHRAICRWNNTQEQELLRVCACIDKGIDPYPQVSVTPSAQPAPTAQGENK